MKFAKINFVKLLKNYHKGWVGISMDFKKVIISGKTLPEVRKKAKDLNEKVYFFEAGNTYGDFVGTEA